MVGTHEHGAAMRDDVGSNKVILAVSKAIEARFDRGDWIGLGILSDARDVIENHGRLLRSLHWGDDDYHGNIFVEYFLGLPGWLREREPDLHAELYGGQETHATDDLQAVARQLGRTGREWTAPLGADGYGRPAATRPAARTPAAAGTASTATAAPPR